MSELSKYALKVSEQGADAKCPVCDKEFIVEQFSSKKSIRICECGYFLEVIYIIENGQHIDNEVNESFGKWNGPQFWIPTDKEVVSNCNDVQLKENNTDEIDDDDCTF